MALSPQELKERLKGVVALVMTPFDEDERLDESALRKGVQALVENLRGDDNVLLVNGSTGEFYAMTEEEIERVITVVVEEAGGKMPVIAGTGQAGTKLSIHMSQRAEQLGVDGVMVVNPYYHLVTTEGLYRHFQRIADSLNVGIMLYNNPVTSKLWMGPELVARLSKIPNIIANKENTPMVSEWCAVKNAVDEKDMVVISGLGENFFQYHAAYGSRGYVSTLPNIVPGLAKEIWKSGDTGNTRAMLAALEKVGPLNRYYSHVAAEHGPIPSILGPVYTTIEHPVYQSVTKEAMTLLGVPGGKVRAPMDNLTSQEITELKKVLQGMQVL